MTDLDLLTADDLDALALGCAVLGTGGGGDTGVEELAARLALDAHGSVPLVRLTDLPDDGLVLVLSSIGAPTVASEMIGSGLEAAAIRELVEEATGRKAAAVMAAEIGGANGIAAVTWAAQLGLPLVDADGMGRAFPELQMISMHVAGLACSQVFLVDALGNRATLEPTSSGWAERWARALCVASGSSAVLCDYVLGPDDHQAVIHGTVSQALRIGRTIRATADPSPGSRPHAGGGEPLPALAETLGARVLISGMIEDIARDTHEGFVRGTVTIGGRGADHGREVLIALQNENLLATEAGQVLAGVPDLITVCDTATAIPVSTEALTYGQRVSVLAWPCDPLWRTPTGLAVAGPSAFGYSHPYVPVETTGRPAV
ncbi:DUF917 domain-containing protein [Streptomyces sp. NPDC001904]|uniref:DUF917 domain-containing protein n=1 Tax=Streptomyces sp. NPDC001904 TaxID=3154531 RepID=UPI00332D1D97